MESRIILSHEEKLEKSNKSTLNLFLDEFGIYLYENILGRWNRREALSDIISIETLMHSAEIVRGSTIAIYDKTPDKKGKEFVGNNQFGNAVYCGQANETENPHKYLFMQGSRFIKMLREKRFPERAELIKPERKSEELERIPSVRRISPDMMYKVIGLKNYEDDFQRFL